MTAPLGMIEVLGSRQRADAQILAGWVLDGRAIQDLWIGIPPGQTEKWVGTTLRFYDAGLKAWRVSWIAPRARAITLLTGRIMRRTG